MALICGALLGKFTFDRYENLEVQNVISYDNNVYLLRYGTYKTLDDMSNSITDIDRYIYIQKDDEISAYVAIAKSLDSANKLKKIYDAKKIDVLVVKQKIENDEFIQNLNEYEKLLAATDDENSLLIIEKQILSCYESVVVKDE